MIVNVLDAPREGVQVWLGNQIQWSPPIGSSLPQMLKCSVTNRSTVVVVLCPKIVRFELKILISKHGLLNNVNFKTCHNPCQFQDKMGTIHKWHTPQALG
jgi:hypothetical protein